MILHEFIFCLFGQIALRKNTSMNAFNDVLLLKISLRTQENVLLSTFKKALKTVFMVIKMNKIHQNTSYSRWYKIDFVEWIC